MSLDSLAEQASPMTDSVAKLSDGTPKRQLFRSPPRIVFIKPKPSKETSESTRQQVKRERERKAELVKQEKQRKGEAMKLEKLKIAEESRQRRQKEHEVEKKERERKKSEQREKAHAEKQVKIGSVPVSPEEAAKYDRITAERVRYMDQQKELQRTPESECIITPVMTDEQMARCSKR